MKQIITAIVMGGSTNALGQIRAAHQAGYDCINIVEKGMHAWSRKSKYCKGYYNNKSSDPRVIQFIIQDLFLLIFIAGKT